MLSISLCLWRSIDMFLSVALTCVARSYLLLSTDRVFKMFLCVGADAVRLSGLTLLLPQALPACSEAIKISALQHPHSVVHQAPSSLHASFLLLHRGDSGNLSPDRSLLSKRFHVPSETLCDNTDH